MSRAAAALGLAAAALPLAGCGGALEPSGEGASRIAELWWVMLGLTLAGFAVFLGALAAALLRRRRADEPEARPASDRRFLVLGGVALPLLVVLPIVGMTLWTSRALAEADGDALRVEVTGHRFWWDLRYPGPGSDDPRGEGSFRTANELHVPVGRPVELVVTSVDVIHSVWIPRLHGKIDLIPGRTNRIRLEASEPGVYRGRCAEFCGLGHAFMRLLVVAHPEAEFRAWWEREAGPVAEQPSTAVRQELANSCAPCHTFRGVYEEETFRGDFGPDLTHLAARRMLAANLLSNTREGLGRWIVDPQGVKPGSQMPDVGVDGSTLADLVDYLERLR